MGGVGVLEYSTQNGTGMHHLQPQNPKKILAEDPQTPLKACIIWGYFNKHMHTLSGSALHAFRLFG